MVERVANEGSRQKASEKGVEKSGFLEMKKRILTRKEIINKGNENDLQIAGHSQSPTGNLATTSTRPYLMLIFPFVLRRAD